jgi:hypothetical protein
VNNGYENSGYAIQRISKYAVLRENADAAENTRTVKAHFKFVSRIFG